MSEITQTRSASLANSINAGRLLLAGDYFSYLSGWMEGAVRSAELAVKRIARMAAN